MSPVCISSSHNGMRHGLLTGMKPSRQNVVITALVVSYCRLQMSACNVKNVAMIEKLKAINAAQVCRLCARRTGRYSERLIAPATKIAGNDRHRAKGVIATKHHSQRMRL